MSMVKERPANKINDQNWKKEKSEHVEKVRNKFAAQAC